MIVTTATSIVVGMARLRYQLRSLSRRKVPLTSQEFESLKEAGTRPVPSTIPDGHRECLVNAGYIREVVLAGSVYASVLTGAGMRRLETGQ